MVQVQPGPPFKIINKYAAIHDSPLIGGIVIKNHFAKNLPHLRVGRAGHYRGVPTRRNPYEDAAGPWAAEMPRQQEQ
ncbi:MAG: hypothetical protein DMG43_09815 [Acidobacteria bacterium]|nr:MAG: hypothetical protein DMG43_09815 [Acidobacteriota bacterium]